MYLLSFFFSWLNFFVIAVDLAEAECFDSGVFEGIVGFFTFPVYARPCIYADLDCPTAIKAGSTRDRYLNLTGFVGWPPNVPRAVSARP